MIFLRILRRLKGDQRGSAAFDLIIVMPLFAGIMLLTTTAYGYFKADARNIKASWAMVDAVSRQEKNITPTFLTTLVNVHEFITGEESLGFRLSVIDYDEATAKYRLRWSQARGKSGFSVPQQTMEDLKPRLPSLADQERIILLQTYLQHQPLSFTYGFAPKMYVSTVISRPRNGPQICWHNSSIDDTARRVC